MGGARALEWAAMYPEMAGAACVIATSARSSAWQIGIQTAQICAVEADPDWQNGDYYDTGRCPDRGLGAARRIAHLTYRGERELDARFGSAPQKGEEPFSAYRNSQGRFAVESYLDHQASKLLQRFDAGTYVALTHAVNRHDVGRERGGVKEALASITIPVLVAGPAGVPRRASRQPHRSGHDRLPRGPRRLPHRDRTTPGSAHPLSRHRRPQRQGRATSPPGEGFRIVQCRRGQHSAFRRRILGRAVRSWTESGCQKVTARQLRWMDAASPRTHHGHDSRPH